MYAIFICYCKIVSESFNRKAAFLACADQTAATAEYKLLQLKQCLAGEALKAIKGLGHSVPAYQTAKEGLERKFGGQRQQSHLYQCTLRISKIWKTRLIS